MNGTHQPGRRMRVNSLSGLLGDRLRYVGKGTDPPTETRPAAISPAADEFFGKGACA